MKKTREIFLAGMALLVLFIVLESVLRLFAAVPSSLAITNLNPPFSVFYIARQDAVKDGKLICRIDFHQNLYVRTPTGDRLKRSVTAVLENHPMSKKTIEIRTNNLGFRYPELGVKRKEDFRVLVLGDSITLGDYAAEEDTYPSLIEKHLKQRNATALKGKNVQAINAGVSHIDIQNEFAILMETGLQAQPDIVLVGLFLNDAYESPTLRVTRLPGWLKHSYLLRFIFYRFDRLKAFYRTETLPGNGWKSVYEANKAFGLSHKLGPKVSSPRYDTDEDFNRLILESFRDWGYAWSEDYWLKVTTILRLMKEAADEKGFKLAVVQFPVSFQVHSKVLKNEPQLRFGQELSKLRIAHLDLLSLMRQKYQRDGVDIFYDHCHYRPEGNDFVAQSITDFLLQEVIPQTKTRTTQ